MSAEPPPQGALVPLPQQQQQQDPHTRPDGACAASAGDSGQVIADGIAGMPQPCDVMGDVDDGQNLLHFSQGSSFVGTGKEPSSAAALELGVSPMGGTTQQHYHGQLQDHQQQQQQQAEQQLGFHQHHQGDRVNVSEANSHCVGAFERLLIQREQSRFTDLTLSVQGREFMAHRCVMAAASPWFDSRLKMHKVTKEHVLIEECKDYETFYALLTYVYTGQIGIDRNNVAELLHLSKLFGMAKLRYCCSDYLIKGMDVRNVHQVLELACRCGAGELTKQSAAFLEQNFDHIFELDRAQLLNYPLDLLLTLLEELRCLPCSAAAAGSSWPQGVGGQPCGGGLRQELLLTYLAQWVAYDPAVREEFYPQLLEYVDWALVSTQFVFGHHLEEEPLFSAFPDALFSFLHTLCRSAGFDLGAKYGAIYQDLQEKLLQGLPSSSGGGQQQQHQQLLIQRHPDEVQVEGEDLDELNDSNSFLSQDIINYAVKDLEHSDVDPDWFLQSDPGPPPSFASSSIAQPMASSGGGGGFAHVFSRSLSSGSSSNAAVSMPVQLDPEGTQDQSSSSSHYHQHPHHQPHFQEQQGHPHHNHHHHHQELLSTFPSASSLMQSQEPEDHVIMPPPPPPAPTPSTSHPNLMMASSPPGAAAAAPPPALSSSNAAASSAPQLKIDLEIVEQLLNEQQQLSEGLCQQQQHQPGAHTGVGCGGPGETTPHPMKYVSSAKRHDPKFRALRIMKNEDKLAPPYHYEHKRLQSQAQQQQRLGPGDEEDLRSPQILSRSRDDDEDQGPSRGHRGPTQVKDQMSPSQQLSQSHGLGGPSGPSCTDVADYYGVQFDKAGGHAGISPHDHVWHSSTSSTVDGIGDQRPASTNNLDQNVVLFGAGKVSKSSNHECFTSHHQSLAEEVNNHDVSFNAMDVNQATTFNQGQGQHHDGGLKEDWHGGEAVQGYQQGPAVVQPGKHVKKAKLLAEHRSSRSAHHLMSEGTTTTNRSILSGGAAVEGQDEDVPGRSDIAAAPPTAGAAEGPPESTTSSSPSPAPPPIAAASTAQDVVSSVADMTSRTAPADGNECRQGPVVWKCDRCTYSSTKKDRLKVHAKRHENRDKMEDQGKPQQPLSRIPETCPFCRTFRSTWKTEMVKHIRREHVGPPPFSCPDCAYVAKKLYQFLLHRQVHSTELSFRCAEPGCTFAATTQHRLGFHIVKVHRPKNPVAPDDDGGPPAPAGATKVDCSKCGKVLSCSNSLKAHQLVHAEADQLTLLKCDQCPFVTKYKNHLVTHNRLHLGHVYRCSVEGCQYVTPKRNLKEAHERAHRGEKNFQCDQCDSAFVEKSQLTRHTRTVHSDATPFACDLCKFRTKRRDKLKNHILKVHKVEGQMPDCKPPVLKHGKVVVKGQ